MKESNTEKFKEKDIRDYIGIALIFVIILIGIAYVSSFAFLKSNVTAEKTEDVEVNADCLSVNYNQSIALTLNYNYPIKDEKVYAKILTKTLTPVEVTVENACSSGSAINYVLALTTLYNKSNSVEDYITTDKIRKYVGKTSNGIETPLYSASYLNALTKLTEGDVTRKHINNDINDRFGNDYNIIDNYIIDTDSIDAGASKVYKMYLWIDYYEGDQDMYIVSDGTHNEEYDNTTENKKFAGAVSLVINP